MVVTPLDSTSATVRRHASAFTRTWPELSLPPKPPQSKRAPDAVRVELADLDHAAELLADAPTAVRTAVRNAITGRWTWLVHYGRGEALGRLGVESESLVLRAARPRAFPWTVNRVVAVWRRTGGAGAWSFEVAWRWSLDRALVTHPLERLAAGELAWWLKTAAVSTTNPRPPKKGPNARR